MVVINVWDCKVNSLVNKTNMFYLK